MSLLGRGGMGEVYLADVLVLGEPVALKFLPVDAAKDAMLMDRFLTEVRLARQVTHPNVARVHDIAEADGRTFLSMEYVDGEDLHQLLKRIGRLPAEKAIEIAKQICEGLFATVFAGLLMRFGLLSAIAAIYVFLLGGGTTLSLDPGNWAFHNIVVLALALLGLAIWGYRSVLAGRPAFADAAHSRPSH